MKKVVCIVGPTASGKTALSIKLAKLFDAEIINADSVQIYKELNIGSAKVTKDEMQDIKHHLLSISSLGEKYTIFDYQKDVRKIIDTIDKPFLVGGSGLYIKAALNDYTFKDNKVPNEKNHPLFDILVIYLDIDRKILAQRVQKRVDVMIESGFIDEVKSLIDQRKNLNIIGYQQIIDYIDGKYDLFETKEIIVRKTMQYAKRQKTWFKHQMNTHILDALDINLLEKAKNLIEEFYKL